MSVSSADYATEGRQGGRGPEHHPEREEVAAEEAGRSEWDISLRAVVVSSSGGSDAIGAIEFDPSGNTFATGGIARKLRLYSLTSILHDDHASEDTTDGEGNVATLDHARVCDYCICAPAKLSSLKFRPRSGGRIVCSGDYDGVVMEYDLRTGVPTFERDEHGGRKIWSVDYTIACGHPVGASGSDDGTAQLWDTRGGTTVAALRPGASPVCSVEFDPFTGSALALGCSDRRAYVYDVRNLSGPAVTLAGHSKAVTYARFVDPGTLVTAGTDGFLKLWDLSERRVVRRLRGHVNSKNFVGLSVWREEGMIGCGSEDNRVVVYDRRWSKPVWSDEYEPARAGVEGVERRFVNSVGWREAAGCTLVAAGSDGVLQVYVGQRKP